MNRAGWIGTAACVGMAGVVGLIATDIPASRAAPNAAPCPPAWRLVAAPDLGPNTRARLEAVAAGGPTDVWAIGEFNEFRCCGLAEHWDGTRWSNAPGMEDTNSHAVAVPAPGDAWAVGYDIKHWDGSRWNVVPFHLDTAQNAANEITSYQLYGVAGITRDDVWAVGAVEHSYVPSGGVPPQEEALAIHWDGSRWNRVPVSDTGAPPTYLQAVTPISRNNVWALGYRSDDQGFVSRTMHWNGISWAVVPLPAKNNDTQVMQALAAGGPNDVWAVGYQVHYGALATAAPNTNQPPSQPLIEHWNGTTWSRVPDAALGMMTGMLNGVTAHNANDVWAVGSQENANTPDGTQRSEVHTLTLHWDGVHWAKVTGPNLTSTFDLLNAVVAIGPQNVWAVGTSDGSDGTLLAWYSSECGLPTPNPRPVRLIFPTAPPLGTPPPPSDVVPLLTPPAGGNPTTRVPDPHDPQGVYFPLVGHGITEQFYDYWRNHGGLAQFGYPLTEEFLERNPADGYNYRVQYFERNRFEWHTENAAPYNILLGLLGSGATAGRISEAPFRRVSATAAEPYFAPTGHTLAAEFAAYWQAGGGLPVYGYPISEPFSEVSPTDGRRYLVQYFQRNRLEYHPELPAAYRVSLGLLGVDLLRARGWLP